MTTTRRRYFLLDEVVPACEIPNMMGRLVEDIFLPMKRFAPFSSLDGKSSPRRPQDILPSILPQPISATSRQAVLQSAPNNEVHIALSELFGLDVEKGKTESAELAAQKVDQYSLAQSREIFDHLMRDPGYASDARKILQSSPKKRVFMVVGFMTTSGSTLKRSVGRKDKYGFHAAIPISIIAPGLPPILDPKLAASTGNEVTVSTETVLPGEHIFTMAYDIIEISRKLDFNAAGYIRRDVSYRGGKRAKSKHLAMGKDGGSDEEMESEEDEEEDIEFLPDTSDLTSFAKHIGALDELVEY